MGLLETFWCWVLIMAVGWAVSYGLSLLIVRWIYAEIEALFPRLADEDKDKS